MPFLHAPGFIQARTVDRSTPFPDVSQCTGLQLRVRTTITPPYTGFRFSFGNAHAPGGKLFAYGYKTDLRGVALEWSDIVLPFSAFTDFWDDATGDPIKTCQEDPQYCPDTRTLRNMKTMAIWAEGVAGRVDLEIKEIRAVGCYSDNEVKSAQDAVTMEEEETRNVRRG